jgi:hypothetical protein
VVAITTSTRLSLCYDFRDVRDESKAAPEELCDFVFAFLRTQMRIPLLIWFRLDSNWDEMSSAFADCSARRIYPLRRSNIVNCRCSLCAKKRDPSKSRSLVKCHANAVTLALLKLSAQISTPLSAACRQRKFVHRMLWRSELGVLYPPRADIPNPTLCERRSVDAR